MSIRISINGKDMMKDTPKESYAHLRLAIAVIAKTDNIDAKGPQAVAEKLAKTAANFVGKPETDTIEIFETPEVKNAVESLLASGKVKKLGQRILDALQAESRRMDFVAKSESKKSETGNAAPADEFGY